MLDTIYILKNLKKANISVTSDLTRERAGQLWKQASYIDRNEIISLVDLAPSTIHHIYSSGKISARLAVAMALVLKVDPFYLTAETDVDGAVNDEVIKRFLLAHGYEDIIREIEDPQHHMGFQPRPKKRKPIPAESVTERNVENGTTLCEDKVLASEVHIELSDNDILLLLHAIQFKAAHGVGGAATLLKNIHEILLLN